MNRVLSEVEQERINIQYAAYGSFLKWCKGEIDDNEFMRQCRFFKGRYERLQRQ
jgi:hypothetical protein